jgi:O-methyltransferase involved in polyketide biosynthesis
MSQLGICIRTWYFDNILQKFLKANPDGTVINIGCGLDARFERFNNGKCTWYDLDVPETIKIRRRFFNESGNYRMIEHSALELDWIKKIKKNKPVFIISEGVLMYFEPEDVSKLLRGLSDSFPNAEMVIDTVSSWMVKNTKLHPDVKKYKAWFRWGINTASELLEILPSIEIIAVDCIMNFFPKRWPIMSKLMILIPMFRKSSKLIHIRFAK